MVFLHVQAASLIPECVCVRVHSMWCVFSPSTKVFFFFYCSISTSWISIWFTHWEHLRVCVCSGAVCLNSLHVHSDGVLRLYPVHLTEWDGIETESPLSLHHIYGSYDKSSLFRKSAALMQVILCEPDSVKHNKSNQNWAKHMNTNLWCPAAEGDEEEWPLFYPSFLLASHLNIVLIWTRSWLWASSCHISSVWDVVRAVNQSLLWRNKWTDLMDESLPRDVFVLSNQHEHQHNSHIKSKHTV